MRANDKIIYGYVVLGVAFIAFLIAVILGAFETGLIFLLGGIFLWLILMHISSSEGLENLIGTILLVAGFIVGVATFIGMGIHKNILGNHEIRTEGVILALCLLIMLWGLGFLYLGLAHLDQKITYLKNEIKKFYKLQS